MSWPSRSSVGAALIVATYLALAGLGSFAVSQHRTITELELDIVYLKDRATTTMNQHFTEVRELEALVPPEALTELREDRYYGCTREDRVNAAVANIARRLSATPGPTLAPQTYPTRPPGAPAYDTCGRPRKG